MTLTGDGQRSPRDAIREWLQRADTDRRDDQKGWHSTHDPTNVTREDKGSEHRSKRSSAKHTATNLAESLGLRAPFRKPASDESQEAHCGRSGDHRRKRRRRSTSESSYLEPAVAASTARQVRMPHGGTKCQEPVPSGSNLDTDSDTTNDTRSSSPAAAASKRPEKTYERRPRHKTREDRYEPKVSRREGKRHGQDRVKRSSKRKRAKKTGAEIAFDHGPEGTSVNRLTLRPAHGLGIFKRGRASSPIRRGLPDLTFSEMGFLASRRDKLKEQNDNLTKGRSEKGKVPVTEDEISRFFSSEKQVLSERDINRQDKRLEEAAYSYGKAHGRAKRAVSRRSDQRQTPDLPFELPEKPFLGFGNRGAHPFSPIESHGRIGEAALSAAPSEVTQRTLSASTTNYTWSRSGVELKSARPKRHENIVQSSEFPVVSVASNPAASSVEMGPLCPTSNPKLRLPDMQATLSREKPRPSSSTAESTHLLHPDIAAHPPHSQPLVGGPRPTEEGKACHDLSKQHESVQNREGEPEQGPADMKTTITTVIGDGGYVIPSDAERGPVRRNEPEKQVQYLESLLDACKTTLSGLAKLGYDNPASRATEPLEVLDSVGLTEAPSILNARNKKQTKLSKDAAANAEPEEQKTLLAESREDITRPPKQRAAKPPNLMVLSEDGSLNDRGDVSGADPIERRTQQPLRSNCGVHTQQRAPCNAATAFDHRIAGRESLELHHTRTPPAGSQVSNPHHTRTPPAGSQVSNPHQSPGFAYLNADSQQGSGSLFAFEHARGGHSADWFGSSRHTPLGLGAWNFPDSNYAAGDSRLRTAYGTSHTRPELPRDVEVAPQNVQADSLLGGAETQSRYHRDSPRFQHQSLSPVNHHNDHVSWLDEFAEDAPQTDMQEHVLDEEAMYPPEVGIERDVNHLAPSDTDERPVTRFWHPHRLY